MRTLALCFPVLVLGLGACGDDLVDIGDSTSTSTATTGDGDGDPTGDGDGDPTGDGDGDPTGDGDGDPTGDGDGDPTGDGDGDGDPAGDGDGDPTGDGDGDATGDGDGDACVPLSEDPSNIGLDCQVDDDCGEGYVCHPFNGFVFVMQCQILCSESCECPADHSCNPMADNINQWMECQP